MKAKVFLFLAIAVFVFSSVMTAQAQTGTSIWRDDMNYQSLGQLQTAGWTITHQVGINFTGSAIVLDGTQEDTAIRYSNHFPSSIRDWKVEDRSRWTLGSHCGNCITAITEKHSYTFQADGWYSTFVFYRDGKKTTFGNFQETKNEWLTLSMEKHGNQINMYYNGELKSTYIETDTSSSNLIGVDAVSPWRGGSEYDYFEVWSIDANAIDSQNSLLSNPLVVGGIIGAVGVGVGGVLYFFVFGGSGAAGSAGASGGASAGGDGSIIQNISTSPLSGEMSSSPLMGENVQPLLAELYHQQMSNVSEITDIWQDFNQSVNELFSQNTSFGSNLMSMVESMLGPGTAQNGIPSAVASLLPSGMLSSAQPNITPFTDILDQLLNHGHLLYSEAATQGTVNQGSYQDYLEQSTNLLEAFSQMINTQQTTNTYASHIQHQ